MAITEEEMKLVEKRLEAWNEKIGVAYIGLPSRSLTKNEMLKHVKARDKLGEELAKVQLNYIRRLKER